MFYSIDKLILKIGCDPENEMKCPNNSDNSSDVDDCILKLFFRSCSAYYFYIPEVIFVGIHRRRFDQVSTNLFRANR